MIIKGHFSGFNFKLEDEYKVFRKIHLDVPFI